MSVFNIVVRASIYFIIAYTLLLIGAQIAGFKDAYHYSFIKKSNWLFSSFGNGGEVVFQPDLEDNSIKNEHNCKVMLSSKTQKERAVNLARKKGLSQAEFKPISFSLNTWNSYGQLLLFLIATVLALPLIWKSKFFVLITAYLIVEITFYIKTWTVLNLNFSIQYNRFEVGWSSNFLVEALNYFYLIISFPYFGMIFIFLLSFLLASKELSQRVIDL